MKAALFFLLVLGVNGVDVTPVQKVIQLMEGTLDVVPWNPFLFVSVLPLTVIVVDC